MQKGVRSRGVDRSGLARLTRQAFESPLCKEPRMRGLIGA
jgi:hypothetical protein